MDVENNRREPLFLRATRRRIRGRPYNWSGLLAQVYSVVIITCDASCLEPPPSQIAKTLYYLRVTASCLTCVDAPRLLPPTWTALCTTTHAHTHARTHTDTLARATQPNELFLWNTGSQLRGKRIGRRLNLQGCQLTTLTVNRADSNAILLHRVFFSARGLTLLR